MDGRADRVPDAIKPIVGYRIWVYNLVEQRAELYSLSSIGVEPRGMERWEDGVARWIVATCRVAPEHDAPVEACSCGFYAMSSVSRLLEEASVLVRAPVDMIFEETRSWPDPGVVMGRVELAGKIVEHEYGYRAERARIAELVPVQGTEDEVRRLAARLGVSMGKPIRVTGPAIIPLPRRPTNLPPRSPASEDEGARGWLQVSPWGLAVSMWVVLKILTLLINGDL